jgi:hypothetical protein
MAGLQQLTGDWRTDIADSDESDFHGRITKSMVIVILAKVGSKPP